MNAITLFEEKAKKFGWNETGDNLVSKIRDNLMTDEVAFDIVNAVYMEINGQEIRWDEGLSASNILEMLISEYCGINGRFEHVILLFDEFGRYLEYASVLMLQSQEILHYSKFLKLLKMLMVFCR